MKRFMLLWIFCLILIVGVNEAFAQPMGGEFFDFIAVRKLSDEIYSLYVIFKNGDVYRQSGNTNFIGIDPTYVGNFWGSLSPQSELVGYQIITNGYHWEYHYALLSNGDVYRQNMHFGQNFTADPYYFGNFWEGAISIDKSSWGSIKGQYDKKNK